MNLAVTNQSVIVRHFLFIMQLLVPNIRYQRQQAQLIKEKVEDEGIFIRLFPS